MGGGASKGLRPVEVTVKNDESNAAPTAGTSTKSRRMSFQRKTSLKNDDIILTLAKQKYIELDEQKTGYLGLEHLKEVMEWVLLMYQPLGKLVTEEEKKEILEKSINLIEVNHDSKLDLYQFVALFEEVCTRVTLMSQSADKFKSLDTDGSGFLERDELLAVAEWILDSYEKVGFTEDERNQIKSKLILRIDANSDGCLDLYEFSLLFEHATTKIRMMNAARSTFNELDVNKKGYLEREELGILSEKLLSLYHYHGDGTMINPKEKNQMIERILRMFDTNHEGNIDLYKFSHIFENLSDQMTMCARARDKFRELDVDGNGVLEAKELGLVIEWVLKAFEEVSTADHSKDKISQTVKAAIDSNAKLDFKQFISMFTDVTNRVESMRKAKARFEELDEDKSGYLESNEISLTVDWMLLFYSREGVMLTYEEKEAMKKDIMALVDSDKDGKLNLSEFTVIFNQVENKKEEVRRRKSLFMF